MQEIYKKILQEIGDEQHYAQLFYESTAVLLSNLIRAQATEALENYLKFFERYDKKVLRDPETILAEEEQSFLESPSEDYFLKIKLAEKLDSQTGN